jgi:hypothetical protein
MQSGLSLGTLQRSSRDGPVSCRTSSGCTDRIRLFHLGGFGLYLTGSLSPHRTLGDSALTPPSFPVLILWATMAPVGLGGQRCQERAIVLTWNHQADRLSSFLSSSRGAPYGQFSGAAVTAHCWPRRRPKSVRAACAPLLQPKRGGMVMAE